MLRVNFNFNCLQNGTSQTLRLKNLLLNFTNYILKKAMVTPIINGNAVTFLKEQFIGFWRSLTKRALLTENRKGKWTIKSH